MELTIKDNKEEFQKEQDELLYSLLDNRYFQTWRTFQHCCTDKDNFLINKTQLMLGELEIYLTADCNQKCEYCYLTQYDDLYPKDLRNHDLLKKNLSILLDWIIENDFAIPSFEFFSGEILHTDFFFEILDIFEEKLQHGLNTNFLMIPTNGTFLFSIEQTNKLQNYIDKFKEEYNFNIILSLSIDGKIIEEEERPLNNHQIKDDDFYDRMFMFAKHNNFWFHPMVSSSSVGKWIENWKWWKENLEKYDDDINHIMMLEVRNSDWTEESIKQLNEFQDFLIDEDFKKYDNDLKEFCNHIFCLNLKDPKLPPKNPYEKDAGYTPITIVKAEPDCGCTISNALCVRIGDLGIAPCHRTSYDKYMFGSFRVENDKIVGIKANNPYIATHLILANHKAGMPGCDSCIFNRYCLRQCYGANIETSGDPLIISANVCQMLKNKYLFIVKKFKEIGVLDWIKENITPYFCFYQDIEAFILWSDKVLELDEKGELDGAMG